MTNDIDEWNDLELSDKRTKSYKKELKNYAEKYIEPKQQSLKEQYANLTNDDLKEYYYNANKQERSRITKELNRRKGLNNKEYLVFNETDGIYASSDTFSSIKEAKEFIKQFRKRFEYQGYYRTSDWRTLDPSQVKLRIEKVK